MSENDSKSLNSDSESISKGLNTSNESNSEEVLIHREEKKKAQDDFIRRFGKKHLVIREKK